MGVACAPSTGRGLAQVGIRSHSNACPSHLIFKTSFFGVKCPRLSMCDREKFMQKAFSGLTSFSNLSQLP